MNQTEKAKRFAKLHVKGSPSRVRMALAHAHAHARAREIIEEFRLGSIALPARPTVSRARRVIMSLMPTVGAGLVGAA